MNNPETGMKCSVGCKMFSLKLLLDGSMTSVPKNWSIQNRDRLSAYCKATDQEILGMDGLTTDGSAQNFRASASNGMLDSVSNQLCQSLNDRNIYKDPKAIYAAVTDPTNTIPVEVVRKS